MDCYEKCQKSSHWGFFCSLIVWWKNVRSVITQVIHKELLGPSWLVTIEALISPAVGFFSPVGSFCSHSVPAALLIKRLPLQGF